MYISFYQSPLHDPFQNLAIEQCLLATLLDQEVILYLWQNERTVVIGRNQDADIECRVAVLEEDGGHLARRPSGGGAVYHDLGNLCFTFLAKEGNYHLERHIAVIRAAVAFFGIEAQVSGRNDLLVNGLKFSGNAYYTNRYGKVHHGTLLVDTDVQAMTKYLSPSPEKLAIRGVQSVRSRVVNLKSLSENITVSSLATAMYDAFTQVYGQGALMREDPDSKMLALYTKQFSDRKWRFWDTFPTSLRFRHRFSFGEIDLRLQVETGRIQAARVGSDANDPELAVVIEKLLYNRKPDKMSMIEAFSSLASDWPSEMKEICEVLATEPVIFQEDQTNEFL